LADSILGAGALAAETGGWALTPGFERLPNMLCFLAPAALRRPAVREP
jgi:hypothetical protein